MCKEAVPKGDWYAVADHPHTRELCYRCHALVSDMMQGRWAKSIAAIYSAVAAFPSEPITSFEEFASRLPL